MGRDLFIALNQGPDGYPRKVKVVDNGDGTFKATYTPDDCGQYKVNVKYGGKEVPHAPFPVQAYATGKVKTTLGPIHCKMYPSRSSLLPPTGR
jgi:Filamin/ABP280 repeat